MEEKINYIVYKITNINNGKSYIGKHTTVDINDKYFGSGIALKDAIKKYGKDNFNKEILEFCNNSEHLDDREKYWIAFENSIIPNGYNIGSGGNGGDNFTNNPNKELILKKMKENKKPRKATSEERLRRRMMMLGAKLKPHKKVECEHCSRSISNANYKRWHGDKCKENPNRVYVELPEKYCEFCKITTNPTNYSLNHGDYCEMNPNRIIVEKPKKLCEYCKNKFSVENYNKFHGENCKKNPIFLENPDLYEKTQAYLIIKKISEKSKKCKHTDESKKKISSANLGKIVSAETRKKMSDSNRERWAIYKKSGNCFLCEYCNREISTKINYIRWHGINCKMRL